MSRFSAVAVGLLLTVSLAPTVGAVDSLEVALDSGIVRGVDTGATHEWRGVPYVAAPIGDLRWRSPRRSILGSASGMRPIRPPVHPTPIRH